MIAQGLDSSVSGTVLRDALTAALRNLIRAIRRERMNYQTYTDAWLKKVREHLEGRAFSARSAELDILETDALRQLRAIAPEAWRELVL